MTHILFRERCPTLDPFPPVLKTTQPNTSCHESCRLLEEGCFQSLFCRLPGFQEKLGSLEMDRGRGAKEIFNPLFIFSQRNSDIYLSVCLSLPIYLAILGWPKSPFRSFYATYKDVHWSSYPCLERWVLWLKNKRM